MINTVSKKKTTTTMTESYQMWKCFPRLTPVVAASDRFSQTCLYVPAKQKSTFSQNVITSQLVIADTPTFATLCIKTYETVNFNTGKGGG